MTSVVVDNKFPYWKIAYIFDIADVAFGFADVVAGVADAVAGFADLAAVHQHLDCW